MQPFRTAQPPAPAKESAKAPEPAQQAPETPADESKDKPTTPSGKGSELLATYQDSQGKPFVADYLEIGTVWEKQPALKNEVQAIEAYMKEQVSDGKLDNSTKAARSFLTELEQKAGVSGYESANKRITKLLAYIKFRKVVDS